MRMRFDQVNLVMTVARRRAVLAVVIVPALANSVWAQSPGADARHLKAEEFYSHMQAFEGAPAE